MKQHIDLQQLQELSPKAQERLREWALKKGYIPLQAGINLETLKLIDESDLAVVSYLPSIGRCIEFLLDNKKIHFGISSGYTYDKKACELGELMWWYEKKITGNDLCDSLWQVVKEVLEAE